MNWLAHVYLSTPDVEFRLGNLLADLVKGRDRDLISNAFLAGTKHHQSIDAFTDGHPIVHHSRSLIGDRFRHATGILVDIFYDHFLAIDWTQYSVESLESFTTGFYDDIESSQLQLPLEATYAVSRMIQDDRLGSYRSLAGIENSLERVSKRLLTRTGKDFGLERGVVELVNHFAALREDFHEFFPQLIEHAAKRLPIPTGSHQ